MSITNNLNTLIHLRKKFEQAELEDKRAHLNISSRKNTLDIAGISSALITIGSIALYAIFSGTLAHFFGTAACVGGAVTLLLAGLAYLNDKESIRLHHRALAFLFSNSIINKVVDEKGNLYTNETVDFIREFAESKIDEVYAQTGIISHERQGQLIAELDKVKSHLKTRISLPDNNLLNKDLPTDQELYNPAKYSDKSYIIAKVAICAAKAILEKNS